MKKESAMPSRTIGLTCRISLMLHIKMPLLYQDRSASAIYKAQREKEPSGSMAGTDVKLAKQGSRALARSSAVAVHEERYL